MDNYLAELAKSRAELLKKMFSHDWRYINNGELSEIKLQIAQIDKMIDRVLAPKPQQGEK